MITQLISFKYYATKIKQTQRYNLVTIIYVFFILITIVHIIMENVEQSSIKKQIFQTFVELVKEKDIQRLDEQFLQRYLAGHQYNVYTSLKSICNYQSFVNRRRERWLKQKKSRVESILQSQIVDVLDKKGVQDQTVVWIRVEKWDPQIFTADEILQVSGLLCELVYAKTKEIRFIDVIIDLHDFSLKHLHGLSRKFAKRMIFFMSECLPMELLHVYVVRQPKLFYLGYSLFKPFIAERMKKLIHICGCNYDILIDNIGRETLPIELDGTSEILKPCIWLKILYKPNTQKALEKSGYELYDLNSNF